MREHLFSWTKLLLNTRPHFSSCFFWFGCNDKLFTGSHLFIIVLKKDSNSDIEQFGKTAFSDFGLKNGNSVKAVGIYNWWKKKSDFFHRSFEMCELNVFDNLLIDTSCGFDCQQQVWKATKIERTNKILTKATSQISWDWHFQDCVTGYLLKDYDSKPILNVQVFIW